MTVQCAGLDETVEQSHPNLHLHGNRAKYDVGTILQQFSLQMSQILCGDKYEYHATPIKKLL
jgi:hypothetical protein